MAILTVVGSANLDLVVRTESFPCPGETVRGLEFATYPGGKGANQAVAAGKLGFGVRFVGKLGRDGFADVLRSSLTEAGCDLARLGTGQEPTGNAVITVDGAGQNTIVVTAGANGELTAEDVQDLGDGWALVQLEIPLPTVRAVIERVGPTILNPAPAQDLPDDLLRQVAILTPNETEAAALTGVLPADPASDRAAAEALLRRGVRAVVLTLGARGAYLLDAEGEFRVEAPKVTPVDTTAAGDAFNGALAGFLASGLSIREAMPWACRVASISVTRRGAQTSMPTRAELEGAFGTVPL